MPLVKNINSAAIAAGIQNRLPLALERAGKAMLTASRPITPKSKGGGTLRSDTSIKRGANNQVYVTWHAPYAADVNAGIASNGKPIMNWTTPGTRAGFAEFGAAAAFGTMEDLIARDIESMFS